MTITIVSSGHISSGLTITSGNELLVSSGGSALLIHVSSGGTQLVAAGGVSISAQVSSGGIETAAGTTTSTTVSSGGTQLLQSGGLSIGARVAAGGTEQVSAAAEASGTIVSSGGTELVTSGGTAAGASVVAGGVLSAAGVLLGTITDAGQVIGGTVSSGGSLVVNGGGKTSGVTVASGGTEILSGGTAVSTTVASGGTIVFAGGVASGLVLSGGATEVVASGITAGSLSAGSGVLLVVSGTASHAAILSGGTESVVLSGYASATVVSSGGTEVVLSGGTASGTVVSGGGTEVISSGGVLEYNAGGTFSGTLLGAGTLAVGGGTFTFAGTPGASAVALGLGGGTLAIKQSETFGGFAYSGGLATIASGTTLTIAGAATLNNAQIDGPGKLVTTGATTFDALYLDGGLGWTNTGTVTDSGVLYLNYPSGTGTITVTNAAGGVFDITGNGQIGLFSKGTFVNAGLLESTIGAGSSDIDAVVTNTGTITTSTDVLEFDGGGTFGGAIGATGTGTIAFGQATATLSTGKTDSFSGLLIDGGTVNSADAIQVTGTFTETAGALTLASGKAFSATSFDQTGGTLSLGASTTLSNAIADNGTLFLDGTTLTLAGTTSLLGEQIDGPGKLVTTGATTFSSLDLDDGMGWTNTGTVTDSGGLYLDYPSGTGTITVTNAAGAVFDLTANGNIQPFPSGTFGNAGLLEATAGSSNVYAFVTNTGTITATTGTLEFDGGGLLGGTIGATGTGTIAFGGGTFTLAGATQTISGAVYLDNGGTLSIAKGDALTLSGAVALAAGNINGPGTFITTGSVALTGSQFLDGSLDWLNSGTVTDSGVLYLDYPSGTGSATITNAASGIFDFTANEPIYLEGTAGTFANAGLLETTGGSNTSNLYAAVTNTGTLIANAGTLELDGGGTLGGSIGGTNAKGVVLLAQGPFTTAGTATIADDGTSTGLVLASGETWTDSGTILDAGHLALGNASGGGLATLAIGTGDTLDLTGPDAAITLKASATLTNAGTIGKTGGTGDDIISVAIANTGLIDAAAGTLTLAGAVSGTGNLRIEAGSTLELATTLSTTQTLTFNGAGATLKLDKPTSITKPMPGFGAGDSIDLAGVTVTAVGVTGSTLTVAAGATSYTFAAGASLASDHAAFKSDGAGGSLVTLYAEAAAAPHTPEPVVFGNIHVGGTATQALTLTNTAPSGPYSEALDAGLSGATTGFTTAGTITGLAGGASNATALTITENTTTLGTISGTATLSLLSDGTGIDGFGTTALPSQTVTMNGAVYAYAAPSLSATTVNLGAARVNATGTLGWQYVAITNGTTATPYQESLLFAPTSISPGISVGTSISPLAAGQSYNIGFLVSTANAANYNGSTATIGLTSTGVGTSGLAATTLAPETITVNAEVFAPAVAQLGTTIVNFGIVHVGDTTNATQPLTVANAGSGALVDLLTAGTASTSGAVTSVSYAGLGTGLAAGASGNLVLGINTATAGTISGSAVIGFDSHDSALSDIAVAGGTVTVIGQVNNYAVAAVEQTGGAGTLSGSGTSYTLNLGSIAQGSSAVTADLAVLNAALGPADLLGGSFTASGASAYTNTGLTPFSGLGAGQSEQGQAQAVTLSAATAGVFTETITLTPNDSNADFSETLAPETITVTGTVVSTGSIYTLTAAPTTITGTTGNDTIIAGSNTLNSHDAINGEGGTNTLSLVGGGYFDLGAPSTLANIALVTAQESASGTTVYMRNGLDVTLTVTAGESGSIVIYGAADTDVYNLGAGSDTVVVGAATEGVNAGGGTALVQATAAFAGVLVNGGSVGSAGTTTLEIMTGGTATLNAGDTNLFVKLDAATNLNLGTASFITAEGAIKGGDTITAGAANQTLESIGGKDTLIGASGFGDTFLGTAAGFSGDVIKGFGGSDGIDFTDMIYATLKPLAYAGNTTSGKLTVTDGTHSGSLTLDGSYTLASFTPINDGHGGTLIQFV